MIKVGSSQWNVGLGLDPGDVEDDVKGMETIQILGINMAWVLKKLHN